MSIDALNAKVRELAQARRNLAGSKAVLVDRKAQFDSDNRELAAQINRELDAIAAAELMVRTLTLEHFNATGEKKPVKGVEVKVGKEYTIDEAAALVWAKQKNLCLIPESLDVAAVKKLATVQPLPFVTVTDDPKPQIAKDLDAVLFEPASAAGERDATDRC